MASVSQWFKRVLERPGSVDIGRYQRVAADAAKAEPSLEEVGSAGFCAAVRVAAEETLGETPYDVQLVGMLAMLDGRVVEMATGEGKTLVGAMAAAGHVQRGARVHVVAVNDYLARRDAEWMAPFYAKLGVTVGWIDQTSTVEQRREAYTQDVTYVPVAELGFDVLRDRMATDPGALIVPTPQVALVDEADSVLVDEARVPLVLAGAADPGTALPEIAAVVRRLSRGYHYEVDSEGRNVFLTSKGTDTVEKALGVNLYDDHRTVTEVNLALHAHALLTRDVDYIVKDGKVQLVNTSRGRVALLQRWPDGLQSAVEAKERLTLSETGEVLDSITIQGLLTRYPEICGMTGTAVAVGEQLREFYKLQIAVVPPNRPCVRVDEPDRIFATMADKQAALVEEIAAQHATGRPILIGTLDIAESEQLAELLAEEGLDCVVLNAKNDAEEAEIIARAGQRGAITVSTQMAGRGTDIRLGEGVPALGGLYVIGTGRHPSSRLDDQLRGRSGRQGDPGGSVFFVSSEDSLLTSYLPDEPLPKDDAKQAAYLIGHAQRIAEGVMLEIHRNTWRFTRLQELQRGELLQQRDRVLRGDAGAEALRAASPERYAELTEQNVDVAERTRQVVLYHIDRAWVDHLSFLADLREGIHLRALGRLSPFDEYNREMIPAYRKLLDEVGRRSKETFEADGDLPEQGLRRPTATWTYLVQENPFGSEWKRALTSVSSEFKASRRRRRP
ncbi:accessory Sec system translocase SecA2 [Streptosporangiaceae bacterium NEAU-GS5]|nr:accessory Sec system translocase SecA2 [Streptosporangiaceae bacterium NEAU-GS5]